MSGRILLKQALPYAAVFMILIGVTGGKAALKVQEMGNSDMEEYIETSDKALSNIQSEEKSDLTGTTASESIVTASDSTEKKYIKWVDFRVSAEALSKAYELDVKSYENEVHLDWIELLAYLGAKYGGDFSRYSEKDILSAAEKIIENGGEIYELVKDMQYYEYYREAYGAVLSGMVGEYYVKEESEQEITDEVLVKKYGIKAFSPISAGFYYNDYDDFGVSRSYGYKRKHLGHDMMGMTGTPIICVESGYVEAIGWNRYGGWRIGIRSLDKKRYYYYAHLRKDYPYNKLLKEGSYVNAGEVIGYLGRTGYSIRENVNNIDTPHLHFGIQLIFDESQKEGNNEIWIDCYQIIKFLAKNRASTYKTVSEGLNEWKSSTVYYEEQECYKEN